MSDEPPGFNAPRRKARFSSKYEQEIYRRRPTRNDPADPAPTEQFLEEEIADTNETDAASVPFDESKTEVRQHTEPADAFAAPDAAEESKESGDEQGDLLPNFRLNKVYEAPPVQTNPLKDWRWLLVTGLLLAGGLGGGYFLGLANAPAPPEKTVVTKEPVKVVVNGLTPQEQAAVDNAFQASKKGDYQGARAQFDALRQQHPDWWSASIESARASLYLHEAQTAQRALNTITTEAGQPDVQFIMGLLHLTNQELALAENSFAVAVARDPTRPDFFYFWGECLRRDGKPREAIEKFRAALLRNQYENFEGLYQTKLWLSQIQAGQEESSGANKEIDAGLAALPHPPYEAYFAAAAREMKAKRYPQAADWIRQAQNVTEPAVFRVILQDATFTEEAAHPEISAFYK